MAEKERMYSGQHFHKLYTSASGGQGQRLAPSTDGTNGA